MGRTPARNYGSGSVGSGSVGVGIDVGVATGNVGVGTGNVGVGTGRVGVGTGKVGVGTGKVGVGTDKVGVGPLPDGLEPAGGVPVPVGPGEGRAAPLRSLLASCTIVGESGATASVRSAR